MATTRKPASALTSAEQSRYRNGVTQLIESGFYGQLVAIHSDMSHDQHGGMGAIGTERFLPWHRDFLLQLERELQRADPNASIPYWDWSVQRGVPPWMEDFLPTVPVPGRRNPIQVRRSTGRRGRLPAAWEIEALVGNARVTYTTFTSVLEGFHNEVHGWVGGAMGSIMVSPADPLFWMHHAQIDRLWSVWQSVPGNARKAPTLRGADAILDPWRERATDMQSISRLNYSYPV
jgi:tyrosinase